MSGGASPQALSAPYALCPVSDPCLLCVAHVPLKAARGCHGPGCLVAELVFLVARMALDPFDSDLVAAKLCQHLAPEIVVQADLALLVAEIALFPGEEPALGNAVGNVLAVGHNCDLAGLVQGAQAHEHSHDFHAVVGRAVKPTADELFVVRAVEPQKSCPAPWATGVAEAGSVRVDGYLLGHVLFLLLFLAMRRVWASLLLRGPPVQAKAEGCRCLAAQDSLAKAHGPVARG